LNLADLPPRMRQQAEKQLKIAREQELPIMLEAARSMCDAAEAPAKERELLKLCCNDLCRRGVPFLHLSPKAREKAGWPDLCFCVNGKFYGIELKKARGGVVSDAQKTTLAQLAKCGAVVGVVRTFKEWQDVTGLQGGVE
jgi:hypothetical protein